MDEQIFRVGSDVFVAKDAPGNQHSIAPSSKTMEQPDISMLSI